MAKIEDKKMTKEGAKKGKRGHKNGTKCKKDANKMAKDSKHNILATDPNFKRPPIRVALMFATISAAMEYLIMPKLNL